MIQWQFLIQKEGDQDWLPLESPNVEILEGRYYLMAQVGCPSAQVEVQIRHEYELDGVPQDVTQRRRQRTDAEGLLELFGLTYLPPGLWELQCQIAGEQGTQDNTPPQKLFLQVLAQDFELLSDWAVPEPTLDEMQSTDPVATHQSVVTVTSAPPQTPPIVRMPIVQLPAIPKEIAPLPLRLSDPLSLPPIIYRPSTAATGETSPQLPNFLPSGDLIGIDFLTSDLTPISPPKAIKPPLALTFLRRVAKATDRQEAYKAFEPLAQRQRFLKTLNTLAQDAPTECELLVSN
jgi:hypothetical protein